MAAESQHLAPRSGKSRRSLGLVGAGLLGTVVIIWFGLATVGARRICFPDFYVRPHRGTSDLRRADSSPPEFADPRAACGASYQSITLTRRDGLRLAAWFVPASKPAAIILLADAGGNRHRMIPWMKFLHAADYPVMMVDDVNQGDSDDNGRGVGYGWRERDDVLAAAAALRAWNFARIGGLGTSQGAAALILAQARAHSLDAIVSDSSYADLGGLLRRLPSLAPLNPLFIDTLLWESGLWLGRSPDRISPAEAAAHLGDCALLIIEGDKDPIVPVADARAIYAAAKGNKELWIVSAAGHFGAIRADPSEYRRRVVQFFDRHLLAPGGGAPIDK